MGTALSTERRTRIRVLNLLISNGASVTETNKVAWTLHHYSVSHRSGISSHNPSVITSSQHAPLSHCHHHFWSRSTSTPLITLTHHFSFTTSSLPSAYHHTAHHHTAYHPTAYHHTAHYVSLDSVLCDNSS